ncbi:MAG: TetR/AcrR family transcriptional regulator [Anaerolineales bacterium]
MIAHHQRERILAGAARAIAERGYRQVTVADIVKSAAIARARFYEHFSSKEDCFLTLHDVGTQEALDVVSSACAAAGPPERVRTGIEALVDHVETHPDLSRALIVEAPAAGNAIGDRFERMLSRFAELLRHGWGDAEANDLAPTIEETVVGGIYWLLYHALLEHPDELGQLVPQLTEFAQVPLVAAEQAPGAIS